MQVTNIFSVITRQARQTEHRVVIYVNPRSYMVLRNRRVGLEQVDEFRFDGVLMVLLLRLFGHRVSRRSFDLTSDAPSIWREASARRLKVFLVGGRRAELTRATERMEALYGQLDAPVLWDGYEGLRDIEVFLGAVRESSPSLVIVGLGSPRQELLALRIKELAIPVTVYTCGAFITQTGGGTSAQFYPAIVDALNLRFAYRMIREPHTLRRYFFQYPIALSLIAWDGARAKIVSSQSRRGRVED